MRVWNNSVLYLGQIQSAIVLKKIPPWQASALQGACRRGLLIFGLLADELTIKNNLSYMGANKVALIQVHWFTTFKFNLNLNSLG